MVLATCTLALQPTTPARCTGRTSRLSRTSLASSTLAPPEAAEDVLPLDVGERKALSVTERLSRSLTFYSRVLPILARYKLAELDLEQRCADECRTLGFCCADHAVGANDQAQPAERPAPQEAKTLPPPLPPRPRRASCTRRTCPGRSSIRRGVLTAGCTAAPGCAANSRCRNPGRSPQTCCRQSGSPLRLRIGPRPTTR